MIVDILAFLALVAAAAYPLTKNFWHDTLGLGRQIEQLNNKGQCEQIPGEKSSSKFSCFLCLLTSEALSSLDKLFWTLQNSKLAKVRLNETQKISCSMICPTSFPDLFSFTSPTHSLTFSSPISDSYFHPETGLLYLACAASVESRSNWMPGFQKFVQPSTSDYIAILDTRGSGSYASRIQKIEIKDFFEDAFRDEGRQEGTLNLHAIGIEADKTSTKGSNIRIHLNNHKPYYNQDGTINASSYLGANSTIEVFTSKLGSSTFNHLKTISSPSIVAPNSIAPLNSETFLFTNDHDVKTAWDRDLKAMIQASGNVGFCDEKTCGIALEKRHFPNGIVKSEKDGLIYLASSTKGHVQTFRWEEGKQRLVLVNHREFLSLSLI